MRSNESPIGEAGRRIRRRSQAGIISLVLLSSILMIACSEKGSEPAKSAPARQSGPNRAAVIETDAGTIKFELLENDAPKTAENFRLLADRGWTLG